MIKNNGVFNKGVSEVNVSDSIIFSQKTLSLLIIISLVLSVFGFFLFLWSFWNISVRGVNLSLMPSVFALVLCIPIFLNMVYHRKLKGAAFIFLTIIFAFPPILFVMITASVNRSRIIAEKTNTARYNLRLLGKSLVKYAESNDGFLPDANQWCDTLMKYDKSLSRQNFKHPRFKKWDGNIAFNENLSDLKISKIPKDIVLLFEADGDWNLSGGMELFQERYTNQKDYYFSYVVLMAGSVKTYRFQESGYRAFDSNGVEYIEALRWRP